MGVREGGGGGRGAGGGKGGDRDRLTDACIGYMSGLILRTMDKLTSKKLHGSVASYAPCVDGWREEQMEGGGTEERMGGGGTEERMDG